MPQSKAVSGGGDAQVGTVGANVPTRLSCAPPVGLVFYMVNTRANATVPALCCVLWQVIGAEVLVWLRSV